MNAAKLDVVPKYLLSLFCKAPRLLPRTVTTLYSLTSYVPRVYLLPICLYLTARPIESQEKKQLC